MAEKKQTRDKNGRFTSKDGATKKTKQNTALDYKKLYEQQLEVNDICIARIIVRDAKIDAFRTACEELSRKHKELKGSANFWEQKANRYFNTIQKQADVIKELDKQREWYFKHLSIFSHLFHSNRICKMKDAVFNLRNNVLDSMVKW